KALLKTGIQELYPPQEEAIRAGVLEGKNLVLSVPTASGKTLVAELCAIKHIMERQGKVLYLVPLKALASEKYEEFRLLEDLGIKVALSTGDFDTVDPSLAKYDLIIATNEKADSIIRHRPQWIDKISLIVADEVHLLGEPSRGPTLEALLTALRITNPKAQFLALSATIKNAAEIAEWLDALLVTSDWRPVPLKEGVCFRDSVFFKDGSVVRIDGPDKDPVTLLTLDVIKSGGQMLIFTGSRLSAVSLAKRLSEHVRRLLKRKEEKHLLELSSAILRMGERTRISDMLSRAVSHGVAFHHAGLTYEQRKAIEEAFRSFLIKCICATPTLCLPGDEEIFCEGGPKKIEELSPGDKVLTHKGQFKTVFAKIQRPYAGKLLEISTYGQFPMRMTPEHKVLRAKRRRRSIHNRTHNIHWWEYTKPEWVEARYLKKGDLVIFPRIKTEFSLEFIDLPPPGLLANQFGIVGKHWTRIKTDKIPMTEKYLELFGLFVAEGYCGKNGAIMFALNSKEESLTKNIVDVLSSLGLRCAIKDFERNRRIIRACSKQLASKLRELFGDSAFNKHLPDYFLLLPKEKLIPLVRGMWMGDGWIYKDNDRSTPCVSYSTISPLLAKQLFAILVKLGFMPSISKTRRSDKTHAIVGKHDLYEVKLSGKQLASFGRLILNRPLTLKGNRNYNINFIDDDNYYMVVKRIRQTDYKGLVYNLEVDGDSSYTGAFSVHNSAGVNLPARRVLIYEYRRFEPGYGQTNIPILEEKQMAGRAGRPKYDKEGEAILLARSEAERDFLLEEYVLSEPEKIWSKLGVASSLRSHTLATITTGLAHSEEDLFEFFGRTLFAHQYGLHSFKKKVAECLEMLTKEGLVEYKERRLIPTRFGMRVAELYIDPVSAVIIRDALKLRRSGLPPISYLTLICHTPDMPKLYIRKREIEPLSSFIQSNSDLLLFEIPDEDDPEYESLLEEVKTALLLKDWIEESPEDSIVERFDVGSGDIYSFVESARWLIHSTHELARLFGFTESIGPLRNLYLRIENGVKEELLPLVSLRGVGRVRARALYSAGFRTLEDLRAASPSDLIKVPQIGYETARLIKEQVGGTISKEEWSLIKSKRTSKQLSIDEY
ncbi:MAG: DEAD/DEAH box helicase, partial [Candidatus Methanomethyliaceae archaeon]